jgi:hypothetical protein
VARALPSRLHADAADNLKSNGVNTHEAHDDQRLHHGVVIDKRLAGFKLRLVPLVAGYGSNFMTAAGPAPKEGVDAVVGIAMRDPGGNAETYAEFFGRTWFMPPAECAAMAPESRVSWTSSTLNMFPRYVVHMYGRGDSLDDIRAEVLGLSGSLIEAIAYLREHAEPPIRDQYPLNGNEREYVGFAALALLLVNDPAYLNTFRALVYPSGDQRAYWFDALIKSFIADYPLAKKYKTNKYAAPWSEPLLRALAEPPERRAGALAAHMKNWGRIMRPWGWKPVLDTAPGKDKLFCDFAFEVALAVCAYDIDDSSFNTHPYYPRDLVEHYCAHLRSSRDGWRALQVGSGRPIVAPPMPPHADLAKSKRKGLPRWVELVCDGNTDAVEAVLEVVGKPRKVKDVDELIGALAEENQAILADIKDDDTLAIAAGTLAVDRDASEFAGPAGPPFGPARCIALLQAFARWLEQPGYRLIEIDNDDDSWQAVVVKAEFYQELVDLGATLGLPARNPAKAVGDE